MQQGTDAACHFVPPMPSSPRMSKDNIAVRLYFERPLYESARIIGYGGVSPFDFWERAKALTVEIDDKAVPLFGSPESPCTKVEIERAVEELTRWDKREASPPVYELKPNVRRACMQLLGPPPEHPFGDFIRYGPPDIIGEEDAKRWQEEYRQRKAEEEKGKAEDQVQEQPKKKSRKGRGR